MRTRKSTPPHTISLPLGTSLDNDTKRRPGTGSSTATRPSSAHSHSALAEKLGPLAPPPRAHIVTAPTPTPIFYTPPMSTHPPRTRISAYGRSSFDRSPHLTPAPPRRSNSGRRASRMNALSPSSSLRRPNRAATPSNMSVADSASVYSTASAARDEDGDVLASLPVVREGWRWRPRSQTPKLVLREESEEYEGMKY